MTGVVTVDHWIDTTAGAQPDKVAVRFTAAGRSGAGRSGAGAVSLTYGQLHRRSQALAAGLLGEGLRHGDRVAVLATNRPEHVVVLFACARAGLVLVPLNPRLTPAELAYQLDDAEPELLLVGPGQHDLAAAALDTAACTPRVEGLDRQGLDRLSDDDPELATRLGRAGPEPGDTLFLIYTSGTTGRPKGACLTHANCYWTNRSLGEVVTVAADDVVLQVLPQFHVGGWNVQPLLAWWQGATVVLEPDFDPGRALSRIAEEGVTTMMGVPATYLFMAEHPSFARADLSSLRLAVVGGAPISRTLLATYHDRGVDLTQGYGLTEASPNVLCLPPEEVAQRIGSAGRSYPHVDVALADLADGSWLEGPGRGELCVRGPNVFAGYWRNPPATQEVLRDGWLATGDVAERDDDGYYTIVDRTKDMYISGGENVYPAEVEAVLADHPDVVEAAVVGIPDPRWGEVGRAVVVARAGAQIDPNRLSAFCRNRLAGYKVPREVVVVDELPRSAVGKIVKSALRTSGLPESGVRAGTT